MPSPYIGARRSVQPLASMKPGGIVFLSVAISILAGSGCSSRDDLAVWRIDVPSPDGQWNARAETIQNGGFGSASIDTVVYLSRVKSPSQSTAVLALNSQGPVPHPYVLDNKLNEGGTVGLEVRWSDASHLKLSYINGARVTAAVSKVDGITIGVLVRERP